MLKRWGADKTETKEAYASLLSEKTSLAKLQADQYTGLFEDITKRYDTDLDTLEKSTASGRPKTTARPRSWTRSTGRPSTRRTNWS